jgi:hypothetical protein
MGQDLSGARPRRSRRQAVVPAATAIAPRTAAGRRSRHSPVPIPAEYRQEVEEVVVAAARAGADLRALAAICAEIRRLLASGLLPQRAGQPVKALVHIYFAELLELDPGSALQDTWIAGYRA